MKHILLAILLTVASVLAHAASIKLSTCTDPAFKGKAYKSLVLVAHNMKRLSLGLAITMAALWLLIIFAISFIPMLIWTGSVLSS